MNAVSHPHYDIPAIKRARSLVDEVRRGGIALAKSGQGTFKAHCPFHVDRHPSLLVDERDGHFHCFGCGAHGDVIDFVMRRDRLGFAQACERLARFASRAPCPPSTPRPPRRRWDRLTGEEQMVLSSTATLYHALLWRTPAALDYLRQRGIPDRVARECRLGYADGHSLEPLLRRSSGIRVAQELGLLRKRSRGDGGALRECFAGRLVVPELRGGECIWLIGRDLRDRTEGPKYLALNGERPVLGLERVAGRAKVFLCEGVFDYLTAVSWALPAFSICGTHMPPERLSFLAGAETVYGVFDGDEAGRAASCRLAGQLGQRWRPVALPEGTDLNDLGRRRDGREEFLKLLASARGARGDYVPPLAEITATTPSTR